ncbi:MAG: 2-dehydro-3-deoxygalactonokinase [Alphaproteobacteria bacterium]|nr:MAG: 2-dehydro-3-deoxygalactonokinase [Alphaproteobacteria bacterium]
MNADATRWIAVDWGTSHLRAWVFGTGAEPLARLSSDAGMGGLARDGFEPALLALIDAHLPAGRATPVLCCGMVGARQGWIEAPYAAVPGPPPGIDEAVRAPARDPRLDVRILPGMAQPEPADVMRGEEAQIAGFLEREPGFDGILCLPGTHTKWVHVSAGEVVSFRTFMTGELFALISERSVLRHGLAGEGWDGDAFAAALDDAMSRPEALAARLFSLRAEGLLHDLAPATARARLSGLLIGMELAAARPYWLGRHVALIGAERLAQLYARALRKQGLESETAPAEAVTLAGLAAQYRKLSGARS